ncbi:hypothetical protein [Litoribacter populi]|uniref:hypothetical protein n=1 Tax=Litoribacter populi TaxID=2598460 RepID=UPI00117CDE0D|nr:hypothetical protein [Litoribacter populi]
MKNEIIPHLNDPGQLEKMFRTDKMAFTREFNILYPELKGNPIADFWNERLNYETDELNWGTRKELFFVLLLALTAGLLAKLPSILAISEEFFYPRNIGFIIFPALAAFFAWKRNLSKGKAALVIIATFSAVLFINFLPDVPESDTLILSCLHLIILLWAMVGFAFVGDWRVNVEKRLDYLKFNGDLIVISALICIAGVVMTGVTIGLFSLIGLNIEKFYFQNIVIFGLPAVPIVGTYLIQANPQLVGKVSPALARIFSPLVLVMLVIYLIAMAYLGKDPYNDREFLLIFNVLLIGVMAIIFFSLSESSKVGKSRPEILILLVLSIVTIVVNGIALSAILFRIAEWGFTPNRVAVLGANVLILINLLLVTSQLYKATFKKEKLYGVGKATANYLPFYIIWAFIVTFLFPLIFGVQ